MVYPYKISPLSGNTVCDNITLSYNVFTKWNENRTTISIVRNTPPVKTKWTDGSKTIYCWIKRPQNDSSLNKTLKNDSPPVAAAPSRPVAATPSRLGLLSMLFVFLCLYRNLRIPIQLRTQAFKPSSSNIRQIVSGLEPIRAKWRICCLLYLLYIFCRLWKAETTNPPQSYPSIRRA